MNVVDCRNLKKSYSGVTTTDILKGIDLAIRPGEQVAILGQSGSGKSTLLHILGMLDLPTSGDVRILGQSNSDLSDSQAAKFRNDNLGFIYQFHHLLMEFTALENVAMPLLISGIDTVEANRRSTELLSLVGLAHRLTHLPSQLSGGERQRVAIARALVNQPKLVLADEPTGNLDKQNAQQIFDLFLKVNQELGTTLVVVTHDQVLAERFDRVIKLDDGIVI
ncbi:lipoprotein-releasing ABC transporter ATP-binding protein LolD [Psychrosphaera aestuarii]|uniref:lipoprotein-releasing ABC transporter ATP-binding protein LolD n=1 Tax=Psychrosphaera aestuarii TaxID=1266052 RepID=UPI001B3255E8|nr:lipoprotein-releasing ABC transporter ATP-binding protein LolD [Psychrosphaera aestuarii]